MPRLAVVADCVPDGDTPADVPKDGGKSGAKERAQRGTAGTFRGRRPPKDPTKLKLFVAQREAYFAEKERAVMQAKVKGIRTPSFTMQDFATHMSAHLKNEGGCMGFKTALESWRAKTDKQMMKRPAAAASVPASSSSPMSPSEPKQETPVKRKKLTKKQSDEFVTPPKETKPTDDNAADADAK